MFIWTNTNLATFCHFNRYMLILRPTPVGKMGLLPNTENFCLRMRRECWESFPRHRLQRKPLVSDTGMHYGTCVTHVPWCMSGSLTCDGGENVPGIPGACATCNFAYLVRCPLAKVHVLSFPLPIAIEINLYGSMWTSEIDKANHQNVADGARLWNDYSVLGAY